MLGNLGKSLTDTMKKLAGMTIIDEKTIKKIVAQCFEDYATMMYQQRMFLKGKL